MQQKTTVILERAFEMLRLGTLPPPKENQQKEAIADMD